MNVSFSHLFSDSSSGVIHDPTEVGALVSEERLTHSLDGRDIRKLRDDTLRTHEDAFTQHCNRCRFY